MFVLSYIMVILLCFVLGVFFTLALGVLWSLFITLWLLCFSLHSVVILCLLFTFHGFIFYGFMVYFSKIVNILYLFPCLFKKINLFMSQRGYITSIYVFLWTFYICLFIFVDILHLFLSMWTFYIYLCLYVNILHLSIHFCGHFTSISCLYVDILYPFMTFCGHFGFFF